MEFLTRDTEFFRVEFTEADSDILGRVCAELDDTYERVIRSFGLKKETERFLFCLCPDAESYKQRARIPDEAYQEWMVGNTSYEDRRVCLLSPRAVRDRDFESMMKVLRHEVVHLSFDQLNNPEDVGIVIAEGIAVALAEQVNVACLDKEHCPPIRLLQDEAYFYDNDGYDHSGAYVLFFLKKYGNEAFKKVYASPESLQAYIHDGFEEEAVASLIREVQGNRCG